MKWCRLSGFVAGLSDEAGQWESASLRTFDRYRAFVVHDMLVDSSFNEYRLVAYDPLWYTKPPFQGMTLWLYDESRRYRRPDAGGESWHCIALALKDHRCVGKFILMPWHPNKWTVPTGTAEDRTGTYVRQR